MGENKLPTIDPSARQIVNTNYDTTNIASMDESQERIIKTLQSCEGVLRSHCGPQSGYAMLVNNMSAGTSFEPNLFTRDGIRILSSIEFMSPLERYVKDILSYIGSRVDSSAKDGTTTSMLFSSLFLQKMLQKRNDIQRLNLSFFQMNQAVEELFKQFLEELDTYTFTLNKLCGVGDDEEIEEAQAVAMAGKIAFIQALSSSGGNLELAMAMKEIFEKSPRVAWEFITSYTSVKETGKSFQVDVDEHDARVRCITASMISLNHALQTEYLEENVRVIVYPDALDDMSFKTEQVTKYIKNIPDDQAAILISIHISGRLLSEINLMNQTRKKPIVIWQYSPEQRLAGQNYPWELLILCAIAGVDPFNFVDEGDFGDEYTFMAKKVHWHDTYLDLFGIIDMDEDTCLHPYYGHPEKANKFYTDTIEAINVQLKMYKEGHKPDGKMFNLFMEMLNKVATVHRPTLRLGGPMHEQIANKDVVQDVQGAIMSSLNNGFLINGPFGILFALSKVLNSYLEKFKEGYTLSSNSIQANDTFKFVIAQAMLESFQSVVNTIFTLPGKTYEEKVPEKSIMLMAKDPELYMNVLSDTDMPFSLNGFLSRVESLSKNKENLNDDMDTGRTYPVMQPIVITRELLKRIQELLMKFINTDKIIVYGGVVVKEEKSESEIKGQQHGSGEPE